MLAQSIPDKSYLPFYVADAGTNAVTFTKALRKVMGDEHVNPDVITPGVRIKPDDWFMQMKADGDRFLVEVTDGDIVVLNRQGVPKTSNIPYGVLSQFEVFDKGHWVFDGEIVGKRLFLFDLPVATSLVGPTSTFEDRIEVLEVLVGEWKPDPNHVVLLDTARSATEKLAMVTEAIDKSHEGVMLRHREGQYRPGGRPASLLKAKFTKEVDAIVTALNVDGHDNVVLSLLDPDNDCVVEIGRASAIGKKPKPQIGDVWLVRFLYMIDPASPKLYQPRLVSKRTDKAFEECLMVQLTNAYTDKNIVVKSRKDQV